MRRLRLLATTAALSLAAATAHAQARLEPGEWARKSTSEVPGTYTGPVESEGLDCYTSGDQRIYADPKTWAAEMAAAQGDDCKPGDPKLEGTALSVTLTCGEGRRFDLRHDFRGTTGTMDAQAWNGAEKGTTTHTELRRVADECSAETIESWKRWNPGKEFAP